MKGHNLIVSDWVVRKPTSGSIDPIGAGIISDLAQHAHAVIWLSEQEHEKTEEFLSLNALNWDMVITRNEDDPIGQLRKVHYQWGYSIDMIIETDPNLVQLFVTEGWLVLGYFHPYYSKLDWRPGYRSEITAWDKLKAQVQLQARQHIEDVRVKPVL